LGRTGLSCARYLSRQGYQVAVTVSPGVSLDTPQIREAMARGVPAVGDVELFARAVERPVAAITGSNGKSTVTTLLGLMARAAGIRTSLGGNLGEPVLELLEEAVELDVVELSSFQLETTESLAPAVATVLNLSADHMDRYRSFDEYVEVKGRIYRNAGVGVYNRDDSRVMGLPRTPETLFFTLAAPAAENEFGVREEDGKAWLCRGRERLLSADEVLMPGLHNRANALAALAMGSALELPLEAMRQVLTTFPGLPHRTEFVASGRGLSWYNDSKGTNPGATIAALAGLERNDGSRTVLIAGGQGKSADFSASQKRSRGRWNSVSPKPCRRRWNWPPNWRSPATACCSRQPVPASTCSGVSNTGARCSRRVFGSC